MTAVLKNSDISFNEMNRRQLSPPEGTALAHPMTVGNKTLFRAPEDGIAAGFWEAESGPARFEFIESGEVIIVLEGSVEVCEDGYESVLVTAGCAAAFPKGWVGTWDIHGPFRKFTVIYS